MKKMLKMGLMGLALAAAVPVFAAEEAEVEEGAVGWTPIAFGIASPVQLPWGMAKWDVFGFGFNAFYTDAPKMYGIGIGGLGMRTRDDLIGLQIAGLCSWNEKDIYGLRVCPGLNASFGTTYGVDVGGFAYREGGFWGLDVEFVGAYQQDVSGVQVAGLVGFTSNKSYGWTVAIGGNMAKLAYGCQTAAVFNFTDELHGCQIGCVNFARECPFGFQIGLVNIIMDNSIKVLPLVNGYF